MIFLKTNVYIWTSKYIKTRFLNNLTHHVTHLIMGQSNGLVFSFKASNHTRSCWFKSWDMQYHGPTLKLSWWADVLFVIYCQMRYIVDMISYSCTKTVKVCLWLWVGYCILFWILYRHCIQTRCQPVLGQGGMMSEIR